MVTFTRSWNWSGLIRGEKTFEKVEVLIEILEIRVGIVVETVFV